MDLNSIFSLLQDKAFDYVKDLSFVRNKIVEEKEKFAAQIEEDIISKARKLSPVIHNTLPKKGLPHHEILQLLTESSTVENAKWEDRKVSGVSFVIFSLILHNSSCVIL